MNKYFKYTGRFVFKAARFCTLPLLDVLYPAFCLICENPLQNNTLICPQCQHSLDQAVLPRDHLKTNPVSVPEPQFDAAIAALSYTRSVQTLIHNFKYNGYSRLSKIFAGYMTDQIKTNNLQFDSLQPVPLHSGRKRERGFNQAESLCKSLSKQFNVPLLDCLIRHRYTSQQAKYHREKRFQNVKNAFKLKQSVRVNHIALVDDVITTGATVNECSRLLKESGAREITVLTICRIE
ncbi:MAG: ComF family protein [candidate division KSB1 bacterium]|nr:ComF family protein [candidate division KSB1 bacterium]